jgi:probable rRNA maturation factor
LVRIRKKAHSYTKSNILINNLHPARKLPLSSKSIKAAVSSVMDGEDCVLNEIVLNFVSDSSIKKLNNSYLKHNFYTDIITFPYNDNKTEIEGEIFISLDTVAKNAKIYETGFKRELARVIIHGCLHLAGYNDKTKKQKELIKNKENWYLAMAVS